MVATVFAVAVTLLTGCRSHAHAKPSGHLAVTATCVASGCRELSPLAAGSNVVAEALLWQRRPHPNAQFALLLNKWLVDNARPIAWESDELFPGSCSKPALGRAYLDNQDYFPFSLSTLQGTSWSIGVFDGTTMIGCGSHTGKSPGRANAAPLPDSGTIAKSPRRVVTTVGPTDGFGRWLRVRRSGGDEAGLVGDHDELDAVSRA
jgi:hypothetical protein